MTKNLPRIDLTQPTNELLALSADYHSKLERINAQLTSLQIEIQHLSNDINIIDNELDRRIRPSFEPRVTDHAVLRFIERVFNIDINRIKERILTEKVVLAMKNGATSITVEGVIMKITDNTIVTVYPDTNSKAKTYNKAKKKVDALKEGLDEFYREQKG